MRIPFFILYGLYCVTLAIAQEVDPCRFIPSAYIPTHAAIDSVSPKKKWGYLEIELKPDLNLMYSVFTAKNCKVQANTLNRITWESAFEKASIAFCAEQRLGGMVFPDSLRKFDYDDVRIQINASRNSQRTLHPNPSVQAEFKTALFKNYENGKALQTLIVPRGLFLPASSIISAGFKSEKTGMGSLECGIAGLKIDWMRRSRLDSLLIAAYPNFTSPHYRSINGGLHFTTRWNCALGKYLKLEHSSRLFKPLFPQSKNVDIEMRNCVIFSYGKGLQTSIRHTYTLNQTLNSPADFSGEVVMGYVFVKQKGKR
jgi:hypothetical protein